MISSWTHKSLPRAGLHGCAAQVETGMNLMDLEDLGESFHVPVLFVGLRLLE